MAFAQAPIRVTTRLSETNVIVRDSHGPVADLTPGDRQGQDCSGGWSGRRRIGNAQPRDIAV